MKFVFSFFLLFSACATLKSEEDFYDFIMKSYQDEKYNLASGHIVAFEGKYPESMRLCRLWQLQVKIYESRNKSDNYIKNTKGKIKKSCGGK